MARLPSYPSRTGTIGGSSGGGTAFGGVPKPVAVPPSIYQQVSGVYPGFTGALGQASNDIMAELRGDVNLNELQDLAAALGVQSGMPLTGGADTFSGVRGLRLAEREKYNRKRQGLQDFGALEALLGSQQTDPGLAFQVADRNSVYEAAPDPALAHEQLFKDWERQFNLMNVNPGAGTRRSRTGDSGGIPGASHSGGSARSFAGGLPGPGGGVLQDVYATGGFQPPGGFYGSRPGTYQAPFTPTQNFDWNAWITGGPQGGTIDDPESDWDWMFGAGDYAKILDAPDPWTD